MMLLIRPWVFMILLVFISQHSSSINWKKYVKNYLGNYDMGESLWCHIFYWIMRNITRENFSHTFIIKSIKRVKMPVLFFSLTVTLSFWVIDSQEGIQYLSNCSVLKFVLFPKFHHTYSDKGWVARKAAFLLR